MLPSRSPGVLFISNGHGEDNHAGHIIRALRRMASELSISALPIVGRGEEYRRLDVPIIAPVLDLPSGGFTYHNRLRLVADIRAGLIGLTFRQFRAARRARRRHDLVVAVGDAVAASFAMASGLPFLLFTSSLSALYTGTLRLDAVVRRAVRHPRCLAHYTRDRATRDDLRRQGYRKTELAGIPSLDWLTPRGVALELDPGRPVVALLPGSRLPEAERNFRMMLDLVAADATRPGPAPQFRAALVSRLHARLDRLADAAGWRREGVWLRGPHGGAVMCPRDGFADIVCAADCVIGMAGLAVDQAVGLGKPVIMIAGNGPQFTIAFARAQQALLGPGAEVIGTGPATPQDLARAARRLRAVPGDRDYLEMARRAGIERLGARGGADRIARRAVQFLADPVPRRGAAGRGPGEARKC